MNKHFTNGSVELGKKTLHAETEQELFSIIKVKDLNFQSHTKSP